MNILYLLIILILLLIYYQQQSGKDLFTDNIFSHVVEHNEKPINKNNSCTGRITSEIEDRPDFLPHKIKQYYYCGRLKLNNKNEPKTEIYLYGKPIENIHKIYSYYVFIIKNKEIINSYPLPLTEKVNKGGPIFLRNGAEKQGPFILV